VSAQRILIGCAVILFIGVCALPGAYMFGVSFVSSDGTFTVSNYTRLLSEPRQRELLRTTIVLGAGASAIASIIGVPLGLLLARLRSRCVTPLRVLLLVPLAIPPYVLALTWIFATGYSGISYSLTGAAVVLGIAFFPVSMLASEAGFRRVDMSLEEAGGLNATPARVFSHITLPLVAPLVTAAGLLVFTLSIAEFGVPGLLRVRVFTTEVFTAFAALYDFGRATAFALPLLVITMIAAALARWIIGERLLTPSTTWRPAVWSLNSAQKAGALLFAFAVALVVTAGPILVLTANAQRVMANLIPSWSAIRASVVLSIIAATIVVMIAVLLGYGRARLRSRAGVVADLILIAAFAVPSTVVGVGLIGLWNRPAIPIDLYASWAVVLMAYMARFLPVAVLIIAATVRQVPPSSEEAAEISGVRWSSSFLRIVIPQIRPGIVAAWVVVFIFTFGELGATLLLTPPGKSTLPVRVYTLIANAHQGEIATLALLQVLATVIPICVFGLSIDRMKHA
jgi:iron(III) transport system permease protein